MKAGKLVLLFGPSGSGKNVLGSHVKSCFKDLVFLKSYTTRERRNAEENESYEFVSRDFFEQKIAKGDFLEWAQFGDNFYGTDRLEVERALNEGRIIFKEMEVQGIEQIIDTLSRECLVLIFVNAGSWDTLERRIRARAPISEEELEKRKMRYEEEIKFMNRISPDITIHNIDGQLEAAKESIEKAVRVLLKE